MHPTDNIHQVGPDFQHPNTEDGALAVPETEKAAELKVENTGRTAELPQVGQAQMPDPPAQTPAKGMIPAVPLPQATPQAGPTNIPVIDTPIVAEDEDLIEQEWVDKAKAIVERTREDPHLQNKEISRFKADYIKKRYNKEIKIIEE